MLKLYRMLAATAACLAALCALAAPALADMSAIRINEIGFATRAGDVNTQFVELVATAPGQTFDAELHLEVTTGLGILSDQVVSFGAREGTAWAQGGTWLTAGASFTAKTALTRDGALSRLDATAGTLTLYTFDIDGNRVDLDTISWSHDIGAIHGPYNGQSLQRIVGVFTRQAHPTPTNASGATAVDVGYGYEPQTDWQFGEIFPSCSDGTPSSSYAMLRSGSAQYIDGNLLIRLRDAHGNITLQTRLFSSAAWQPVSAGTRYLAATTNFQSGTGLFADFTLTSAMTIGGGAIELLMPSATGDTLTPIRGIAYGVYTGSLDGFTRAPTVANGSALQLQSDGAYLVHAPQPTNRAGQSVTYAGCFGASTPGLAWHVHEFGTDCKTHTPGFWFVGITPDFVQPTDGRLGMRLLDHLGNVVANQPNLNPDASKPSFLIASPAFVAATGFQPDLVVPGTADLTGGRVQLYVQTSPTTKSTTNELQYGTGVGGIAPPAAGASLVLVANKFVSQNPASPQRSDGQLASGSCFDNTVGDGLRISEFGIRCTSGVPGTGFVELTSAGGGGVIDGRIGLRIFDHAGSLLGDLKAQFAARQRLSLVPSQYALVAEPDLAVIGQPLDYTIPFSLDPVGGRLHLYRIKDDGSEVSQSDVPYGAPARIIRDGSSMLRVDDTTYVLTTTPTPTNSSGTTLARGVCYGPSSGLSFTIDTFGDACRDSLPGFWFLGLVPDFPQTTTDPRLSLRILDHTGALLIAKTGIAAHAVGSDFLIASPLFATTTGLAPDLVVSGTVDPLGGVIQLYFATASGDSTLSVLRYGAVAGGVGLPPPGGSLRASGGSFFPQTTARPTRADGSIARGDCFTGYTVAGIRISELGLRCKRGTPSSSFIELTCDGPAATLEGGLGIRIYDRTSTLTGDLSSAFSTITGRTLPIGAHLLIAPSGFEQVGPTPDLIMPFSMDTTSGRLVLYRIRLDGTDEVLSDVRYGTLGIPVNPGWSIVRSPAGIYAESDTPSPTNLLGATVTAGGCFGGPLDRPILVQALGTRCVDGSAASYVDLEFLAADPLDPAMGMLVQDSTGHVIWDQPAIFTAYPGLKVREGQHLLFTSAGYVAHTGRAGDAVLPVELDPRGGGVVLYVDQTSDMQRRSWVNTIAYGGHGVPAPPPGTVLEQNLDRIVRPVARANPIDSSGAARYSHCFVRPDTVVRIIQLGLRCYLGTPGDRYVMLQSSDGSAVVQQGLGLRFLDGRGALLEDHTITSTSLIGQPWRDSTSDGGHYLGPATILVGTQALSNAVGFAADEIVQTGPASDSGEVQLYWRNPENGEVTTLDRWRYGSTGALPTPPPGRALVRATNGTIVLADHQSARRFDYREDDYGRCGHPRAFGFFFNQVALQCADGSLDGQYVELRTRTVQVFDPAYGLEVLGADGHRIADLPDLFAAHAWEPFPATAAFLLAPASAAARLGKAPDYVLPAALDTTGGSLVLYHREIDGARSTIETLAYGAPDLLPPPGCAIADRSKSYSTAPIVLSLRVRPDPRTFAAGPWPLGECVESVPDLRLSEIAAGCSYEPLDGSGQFVELRNDGPAMAPGAHFTLRIASSVEQHTYPLFAGRTGLSLANQAHWLVAGPQFADANGLTPDELPMLAVPPDPSLHAFLLWSPGTRYSPLPIDTLGFGRDNFDLLDQPTVPFGESVERMADDSVAVRVTPGPSNFAEATTLASDACFGNGVLNGVSVISAFSAGCTSGGPASAFVQIHYPATVGTNRLRLRIQDHTGQVTFDQGGLFGGGDAPGVTNGMALTWLIGAIGFKAHALYAPNIELPITFDALGGTLTLYAPNIAGPELVSCRLPFKALQPGEGYTRQGRYDDAYPRTMIAERPCLPVAHAGTYSWSCYGEPYGLTVSLAAAGLNCSSGDPATSYVQLAYPTSTQCYDYSCYTSIYPPKGGFVRTLDAAGAPLDSIELHSPALPVSEQPYSWYLPTYPIFASGGITAQGHFLAWNRPPKLDRAGGTVQFVMMDPAGQPAEVGAQRAYGTAAGNAVPQNAFFGPYPFSIAGIALSACSYCAVHSCEIGSGHVRSTATSFDTTVTVAGSSQIYSRFFVDGAAGRSGFTNAFGHQLTAMTDTEFRLDGADPSALVPIRVRLVLTGRVTSVQVATVFPFFKVLMTTDGLDPQWLQRKWNSTLAAGATTLIADTLVTTVHVRSGVPFRLGTNYLTSEGGFTALDVTGQWDFDQLPPGAIVTSCHGFGGGPVPTNLALSNAAAFADHVDLAWAGGEASTHFTLERREASSALAAWLPLATLLADGSGHVSYRDDAVTAGSAYSYRLRGSDGSTSGETRVSVPVRARLALAIAGGQPVHGPLEFAVTRPGSAAARLELFDIAGRLVDAHVFTAGGDVTQHVTLNTGTAKAGVFLARLTCGAENRFARVVRVP